LIDISEVWDNFAFIAGSLVAILLAFLASRTRKRWFRLGAIASSSLAFLVTICSFLFVGMTHSNARIPGIASPDGKHIAIVRWWLPGALGNDVVHVSVRHTYSPFAVEVEKGPAEPPDPKVEWLDSHRLLITYFEKGQIKPCSPDGAKVKGIEVLCRN
jgi:hypothetical protein